ncbi:uncharacterized protein LOC134685688 [Mytilus trossulus]|uniref:uncharacterized protein LOC134685688 n=1 Tax=Mytilus trossulus TaxID=6551 RepID=UPI003007F1C1
MDSPYYNVNSVRGKNLKGPRGVTAEQVNQYESLKRGIDNNIDTYDDLQLKKDNLHVKELKSNKKYWLCCLLGLFIGCCVASSVFLAVILTRNNNECMALSDRCPVSNGYILYADLCFCFKYINTELRYDNATMQCLFDGAELARIDTEVLQKRMETYLDTVDNGEVWIQGLLDNTSGTSVWKYNDGTEMTYFNWNSALNQPQLTPGEIYVLIRKSQGYRWHDGHAFARLGTLCQIV